MGEVGDDIITSIFERRLAHGQIGRNCRFSTPLGFASFFSLLLFLREWTETRPTTWQQGNSTPLLWCILAGSHQLTIAYEVAAEATSLLLEKGYTLIPKGISTQAFHHGDLDVISSLFLMLNKPASSLPEDQKDISMLTDQALLILESVRPATALNTCRIPVYRTSAREWCTPFHLSTQRVVGYLLGRGADPNSVDSHGFTPLDVYWSMTSVSDHINSITVASIRLQARRMDTARNHGEKNI